MHHIGYTRWTVIWIWLSLNVLMISTVAQQSNVSYEIDAHECIWPFSKTETSDEGDPNQYISFRIDPKISDVRVVKYKSENVESIDFILHCIPEDPTLMIEFQSDRDSVAKVLSSPLPLLSVYNASLFANVNISDHTASVLSQKYAKINITILGTFIGKVKISGRIYSNQNSNVSLNLPLNLQINVVRNNANLDKIFVITMSIFAVIYSCVIGMGLDFKMIVSTLKKPIPVIIGFCCQSILMPLVAFGIVNLFEMETNMALGFFIAGCAPGGGASNIYSSLLGGDIALSVTMTVVSEFLALGTLPFYIATLGKVLIRRKSKGYGKIVIPYANIVQTLAMILIPLGIGIFIRHKKPTWAAKVKKYVRFFFVFFLVYAFSFGVYINLHIFIMFTWDLLLTAACLPYIGFIAGGATALIMRQPWYKAVTIAIETGIQNVGVVFLALKFSLPQPDSDLAIVAPAAITTMTPLPLLITVIINEIRRRFFVPKGKCLTPMFCRKPDELEDEEKIVSDEKDMIDGSLLPILDANIDGDKEKLLNTDAISLEQLKNTINGETNKEEIRNEKVKDDEEKLLNNDAPPLTLKENDEVN